MSEWQDWEQWLAEWHARRMHIYQVGNPTHDEIPTPSKMKQLDSYEEKYDFPPVPYRGY